MNRKPNTIQRFFHRLIGFKYISALLSRILQPADNFMLFITRGKHTFTELLLPTIEVETIGARTGQRRTHPLGGFVDADRYILVGTNFGSQHHPAWVHNLRAHPECVVRSSGHSGNYMAREAEGDEREKYWQLALSYYKTYAVYEKRAAPRKITVWVLESSSS
jgi:deazaflavin-dependent oxidoreductase (nitroreductase family)